MWTRALLKANAKDILRRSYWRVFLACLIVSLLCSQVISNVPAAILLSGFCSDFSALLTGVNLGGLGTLIASLASLISFKFFAKEYPDKKGAFMKGFTIWNLLFLFVLTAEALLIGAAAG